MPVSSFVLRCLPQDQPAVREQLNRIAGIVIGEATGAGLPVVAETETTKAAVALGEQLQKLKGVKSAVLVYHNFEDMADEAPNRRRLSPEKGRLPACPPTDQTKSRSCKAIDETS